MTSLDYVRFLNDVHRIMSSYAVRKNVRDARDKEIINPYHALNT